MGSASLRKDVDLNVILVATDFSSRADRALRRAAMLAKDGAARLVLAHVVDDDQPERLVAAERQAAEAMLDETVRTRPELRDISCAAMVVLGEPFDGIVRAAQQVAADLTIMGAHRRQILRDIFVGTTVERVMRTGQIPVLMVSSEPTDPYTLSLVAVDLSDCSRHALQTAHTLGFLTPTRVVVLHAFDAMAKGMMIYANVDQAKIEEYVVDVSQRTRHELTEFLGALDLGEIKYSVLLKEGSAAKTIVDVTNEIRPDLLVIGTHGRGGVAKVLLGSVAEEILQRLQHDILVVPPRKA